MGAAIPGGGRVGPERLAEVAGPGGPNTVYDKTPYTPGMREVIKLSKAEAGRLGHDYIGPEHYLLGIIRKGDGLAVQTLLSRIRDPRLPFNRILLEPRLVVRQSTDPDARPSEEPSDADHSLEQLPTNPPSTRDLR